MGSKNSLAYNIAQIKSIQTTVTTMLMKFKSSASAAITVVDCISEVTVYGAIKFNWVKESLHSYVIIELEA